MTPSRIVINLLEDDDDFDVEADFKEFVFSTRETLKELKVVGRRWWNRACGNTYHAVDIWINGILVHTVPFKYGYGNQYMDTAANWLAENGYLPAGNHDGRYESLWSTCERLGIKFEQDVYDVKRKRDL